MEFLRPLLAAKTTDADLQQLRWPMLLSPKIDGIRATVVNGQLVSRTLKPIRNKHTQALFGRPEYEGFDGELVVGNPWDKNLMQQTSSGVNSYEGRPDVTFHIFDTWNEALPYHARYSNLGLRLLENNFRVQYLKHEYILGYDDMLAREAYYLSLGYEGVMLRSPHGTYKQNRSTVREAILLKVKRFHDAEAIITGFKPLYRNLNEAKEDERGYTKRSTHAAGKIADELLGSFNVRCIETGQDFDVGAGFTENQRRDFWIRREALIGKIITYKHFPTGVKEKPRWPIFKGFRERSDM